MFQTVSSYLCECEKNCQKTEKGWLIWKLKQQTDSLNSQLTFIKLLLITHAMLSLDMILWT